MSYIPSHAMPHAFVHEDDDDGAQGRKRPAADASFATALKLAGAALAGLFIYRVLR